MGRRSRVAQAIDVDPYESEGIPLSPAEPQRAEHVAAWAAAHGLEPSSSAAQLGDPVGGLIAFARDVDAPPLVCGARQLTGPTRWFSSSVGTALASAADPVCRIYAHAPPTTGCVHARSISSGSATRR